MNSHTHRDFRVRAARPLNAVEKPYEAARLSVRTVSSTSLFAGGREIAIDHGGALYRLKITRQGKLILNK
ncbi:hemin uptake protein HemP [Pseudaminobacter sp. NGMCC 1.201702]|uniref:hemin uptake protein HemP n=1 Tax=Pseudaminobacter sp. NGMCC 1.201702 TaxID=3391825 RepID=UPI0039EF9022